MNISRINRNFGRNLLFALLLSLVASATAQNQYWLGAGAHYGGAFTVNVQAGIPLFETPGLQHALRPQVTYGFAGYPAVSVTYMVTGAPEGSSIQRYLGAGAGLAFASGPIAGAFLSLHGTAGALLPITDRFTAFAEVSLSTSSLASRIAYGLGIRYTLGGAQ